MTRSMLDAALEEDEDDEEGGPSKDCGREDGFAAAAARTLHILVSRQSTGKEEHICCR